MRYWRWSSLPGVIAAPQVSFFYKLVPESTYHDGLFGLSHVRALGLPAPYDDSGFPQGWGTLIWLEHGRVVWWSGHGNDERPIGIIERTKSLWMNDEPRST